MLDMDSPRRSDQNQIDFIMSSVRKIIRYFKIITKVCSNHRMVRTRAERNKKLMRLKKIPNPNLLKLDRRVLQKSVISLRLKKQKQPNSNPPSPPPPPKKKNRFDAMKYKQSTIEKTKSAEDTGIETLDEKRKELQLQANGTSKDKIENAELCKL